MQRSGGAVNNHLLLRYSLVTREYMMGSLANDRTLVDFNLRLIVWKSSSDQIACSICNSYTNTIPLMIIIYYDYYRPNLFGQDGMFMELDTKRKIKLCQRSSHVHVWLITLIDSGEIKISPPCILPCQGGGGLRASVTRRA